MAWTPLLDGSEAEAARSALDMLFGRLEYPRSLSYGPSFANGSAGIALFHAYYAAAYPSARAADAAQRWLQHAVDAAPTAPLHAGLFMGLAGFDWVLNHITGDVDQSTIDFLIGALPGIASAWDLIDGSLGIALYALSIGPAADELLQSATAAALSALSPSGTRTFWRSPATSSKARRAQYPNGYLDLGVAHGLPGALAVLAQVLWSGRLPVGMTAQVASAVSDGCKVLDERLAGVRSDGYPGVWTDSGIAMRTKPMWCYGATGAACALLSSGLSSQRNVALTLASSAGELQPENIHLGHYGVCHGYAGVSHSFNRLWQLTGTNGYREAAHAHCRHLLQGASVWLPSVNQDTPASAELLSGGAGIGLVLLAAVSPIPPDWDALLLMSSEAAELRR